MARLLIHVEGETEETFVNELLSPHLCKHGYTNVAARLLGNARLRSHRGGIRGWDSVRGDILRHLKEDRQCLATTMVDYYGLPQHGARAWPGRLQAGLAPFSDKATLVQKALRMDIEGALGSKHDAARFRPFVIMHEFEGLLFSDCSLFSKGVGMSRLRDDFQKIRDQFETPEEINDSPATAPSKRVEALLPGYEKPLLGTLAALEIGLSKICEECPRFGTWVRKLEEWPEKRLPRGP
jgi:hypothetical protein